MAETSSYATSLLSLIDASPTPFHAVEAIRDRLTDAGFEQLDSRESWQLRPGGRHFVERDDTSMVAWVVGTGSVAETGFRIVGSHTDSPGFRLKPEAAMENHGYRQLRVEVYGGPVISSWVDRDLSLAGRLVLKDGSSRLFRVTRPLCRIPHLAIHLNREVNDKGLVLNKQDHTPPVLGLAGEAAEPDWLQGFLSAEAGIEPDELAASDLMLYDVVPGVISGIDGEFIHAGRIDNLASCHAALEALLSSIDYGDTPATRGFVLYDHEEIGSQTAAGAASALLLDVLERITLATGGGREELHRALAGSTVISADMAHAVHPNHADKHDPDHRPALNGGPVIKTNVNQKYASSGQITARIEALAREAGVPVQRFAMRSDLPCGSTIGPITAARVGVDTADIGNPMLSMHSIREMAGSQDQESMIRLLTRFYG